MENIINKKKVMFGFLFFFVVVLMIGLVSADKIISPIETTEGYIIEVNVVDYIAKDTDHNFELHVFNKSNGMPIISGITCYMHLYHDGFGHTYIGYQDTVSNQFDYEFNVAGGNFSLRGEYVVKFQCNSSVLGGGQETFFIVNNYGQRLTDALSNNFNWSMMFMMILFIMALIGIFGIRNIIGKFACYWFAHILFIVVTFSMWQFNEGYAISFLAFAGAWKVMFYVSIIAMLPMMILSIAGIIIYYATDSKVQKLIDKGMDEGEAYRRQGRKYK